MSAGERESLRRAENEASANLREEIATIVSMVVLQAGRSASDRLKSDGEIINAATDRLLGLNYEAALKDTITSQEAEIARLTGERALYPSRPGETRAGFSTDGVAIEGDAASIDRVRGWHFDATGRLPSAVERLKEAEAKLTTQELRLTKAEKALGDIEAKADIGAKASSGGASGGFAVIRDFARAALVEARGEGE